MRGSIVVRIILIAVAALVALGVIFGGFTGFQLKRLGNEHAKMNEAFIFDKEREALRDLVQTAHTTLASFYGRSQDVEALKTAKAKELKKIVDVAVSQLSAYYQANKDYMPEEELRATMKRMVAAMRYEGDNYLWINDTRPHMVMHPIKPSLDGQDLSGFADPKGAKLFVEMAEVAKSRGEGMVAYLWEKPGASTPTLKVSYVKLAPELGWVVGTGAWVEDITAQMKADALEQIKAMRLDDGNYFWVHDTNLTMVMHAANPALDGKNLSTIEDTKGKKLFVEMDKVIERDGEGFVDYWWAKPGETGDYPKLSYVKLFEPWGLVVGMGVYVDDVHAAVERQRAAFFGSADKVLATALAAGAVVTIILGAILVWYARRNLNKPLSTLVAYAERVAEGELDAQAEGRFQAEVARLKHALETMVESLKAKMREAEEFAHTCEMETEKAVEATKAADEARCMAETAKCEGMLAAAEELSGIVARISAASEEISAQAEQVRQGTGRQMERVSETATAMEEMNATVLEVAKNASDAAETADAARSKADEGAGIVEKSIEAIGSVRELALTLKENMDELGSQAESIGGVMSVINDIADQTNLLALNAAIEAARAGDAGRGFAVVADEVRKLAEKTMTATKDVAASIQAIQGSAQAGRERMDQAIAAVEDATGMAGNSGEALAEIVSLSDGTADRVRSIATASEQQSAASEEINRAVDEINMVASETAQGMGETVEAIAELAGQASELQALIERIQHENSGGAQEAGLEARRLKLVA